MDFDQTVQTAREKLAWAGDEGSSDAHGKLLDFLRKIKRCSLDALTDQVEQMRVTDKTYHAFRVTDDQDLKAQERGEPQKIIFPISFAQLQTSLAALMAITDKTPFFELTDRNGNVRASKLMELDLDYQLEQGGFTLIRYQWFKDMLKYGFAPLWAGFERTQSYIRQKRMVSLLGFQIPLGEHDVPVTSFEGATFELNDPYTFKWDPAFPITECQRGQYIFNSFRKSYNDLKLYEEAEGYFNLERIPERTASILQKSGERERDFLTEEARSFITTSKSVIKGGDAIMLDSCYVKLVPKQYGLSDLDKVQIWNIVMANEAVIIKAEPSRFEHGLFPISIIEYDPDRHELSNAGMADTIEEMTRYFNWLLNTHFVNVRKMINDVVVVDPTMLELEDLKQRKPIIRLKNRGTIDKAFKQFQINDVTQAHMGDAQAILALIERVTGASENLQGQVADKVRTATEVSSTNRSAIGRMGLLAKLMWDEGLRPLGQQMIQNTQQFVSTPRFLKVTGGLAQRTGISPQEIVNGMLQVRPEDLQGMFSISLIDAATPSDKVMIANLLKEFLGMVAKAPMMIPMLGLDVSQMATQMLLGFGIRNTTDFIRAPMPDEQKMAMMAMMAQGGGAGGGQAPRVQVMPDEQVLNEQKKGNIQPIGQPMGNNGRG